MGSRAHRWKTHTIASLTSVGAAVVLLGSIVAPASFVGCSNALPAPLAEESPADAPPRRGGILRMSSFGDIRGLDPANISDGLVSTLNQLLYAGLVDFDAHGAVVVCRAEVICFPTLARRDARVRTLEIDGQGFQYWFLPPADRSSGSRPDRL